MWNTAKALLGEVPGTAEEVKEAERVADSHAYGRFG